MQTAWYFFLRGQEIRTISRAISCPLVYMMPLLRPFILARRKGHRDTNLAALQGGVREGADATCSSFFDQSI